MTMNRELDSSIKYNSGNPEGIKFLEAQKVQFNLARNAGIVKEQPLDYMNLIAPSVGRVDPELIMRKVETITIGATIKSWRGFRDMSGTDLVLQSSALGKKISKGYLSELESGKIKNPNIQTLSQLAEALGISVWDIYIRNLPEDIITSKSNGI